MQVVRIEGRWYTTNRFATTSEGKNVKWDGTAGLSIGVSLGLRNGKANLSLWISKGMRKVKHHGME